MHLRGVIQLRYDAKCIINKLSRHDVLQQCRDLVLPFQHLVKKSLVRFVGRRFLRQPLPNVRETSVAITTTDKPICMIGNFLPANE